MEGLNWEKKLSSSGKVFIFIAFAILLVTFALSIFFYPRLPQVIATHWNAFGEVDGFMQKFWGVFILPIFSSAITLFFILVPKIFRTKESEKFREIYYEMAIFLSLLFLLAQIHTLLWNIGIKLNANIFISLTLGGLLMSFALILDDTGKRIENETKGDITFSERYDLNSVRAVSLTFKVIGIIAILGAFFPRYSVWFVVVPLMFSPFLIALFISIKS